MTPKDAISPQTDNAAEGTPQPSKSVNESWSTAINELVSTRLAIISAEAKLAAQSTVKKVVLVILAATSGLLCWIILMAGLIGFIPTLTCALAWYHVALIIAGLHLLVVLISVLLLKRKTPPPFSHTRTEFEKDRQWLSKTKQNPISGN